MNKAAIVIRTLLKGIPIQDAKGFTYRLFKEGDDIPVGKSAAFPEGIGACEPGKYFFGVEMSRYDEPRDVGTVPVKVFMGHDITLTQFLELCDKIPDGAIASMVASAALLYQRRHRRE